MVYIIILFNKLEEASCYGQHLHAMKLQISTRCLCFISCIKKRQMVSIGHVQTSSFYTTWLQVYLLGVISLLLSYVQSYNFNTFLCESSSKTDFNPSSNTMLM